MKFFTKQVLAKVNRSFDWTPYHDAGDRYRAYVKTLDLAEPLLQISDHHFAHDGLITKLRQSDDPVALQLTLRCGFYDRGYFNLRLDYVEPEITESNLKRLCKVASLHRTATFHDAHLSLYEIDRLADDRLEHRLMFVGYEPVCIRCQNINVKVIPTETRRLGPFSSKISVHRKT